MKKATVNFWVDVVIGIAFILSAISGLVFLLPITSTSVFGIRFQLWDTIHTWSSLTMIGSVRTQNVSCPKGLTYDPYSGRCRHYVDRDGDGYCDLSVPSA